MKAYLIGYAEYTREAQVMDSVICISDQDLETARGLLALNFQVDPRGEKRRILSCQLLKDSETDCQSLIEELDWNAAGKKPHRHHAIPVIKFFPEKKD